MNATQESWLPVVGHPFYDISSLGRVRSRKRPTAAIMTPTRAGAGYLQVHLSDCRPTVRLYVHRMVMSAFVGECPEGMQVCHNNGDPTDNRLENLRYDTLAANQADRKRHGTDMPGERHPQHVLTEGDVAEMRLRYSRGGVSYADLAVAYGVSRSHVGAIVRREEWAA